MFFRKKKKKLEEAPLKEDIKELRKKLVNLVDELLREFEKKMVDKHGDK